MNISELLLLIEKIANPKFAAEWDQSGVQIAGTKRHIQRLAVTLDPTETSTQQALDWKADFILTHHPLSLTPQLPYKCDHYHAILKIILNSGTWLYAAHTSLDIQSAGPVSWLANELRLQKIKPINVAYTIFPIQLKITLSKENKPLTERLQKFSEVIEWAIDEHYNITILCWPESQSFILEMLSKYAPYSKVEKSDILSQKKTYGYGLIGNFEQPLEYQQFVKKLNKSLQLTTWTYVGKLPNTIASVAYCPGSGMSLANQAFSLGADVFISGDLKYHQAQDNYHCGLIIDVGHFILEELMMYTWTQELANILKNQEIEVGFFPGNNPIKTEFLNPF